MQSHSARDADRWPKFAERLHRFRESSDAEAALAALRDRPDPLVRELDRRPGQGGARLAAFGWQFGTGQAFDVSTIVGVSNAEGAIRNDAGIDAGMK